MKNFLSAIVFCLFLFIAGLFFLIPSTSAEDNLVEMLLNLPAPPPPNPLVATRKARNAEFYSRKNPPPDDAPIEDLMDYWERQNGLYSMGTFNYGFNKSNYANLLKGRSLDRLKEEIEKNPDKLANFLNILPENKETAEFVKRIYNSGKTGDASGSDEENGDGDSEAAGRSQLEEWLRYHSDEFSDDLVKSAREVRDTGEYVSNHRDLLALARVDWEKARPILDRLINDSSQPVAQTLARWAYYQHAIDEGSSIDADTYRRALMATVENKNNKPGDRDLAMDALVAGGDFNGRDDWYFSLLEDETLHDLRVNGASYTGLTTMVLYSDPDRYVDKMLKMLSSTSNQLVRTALIRNLGLKLTPENPEVVRALLPWLEDPNWAKEYRGERRQLVDILQYMEIPESVQGLISVLNEKTKTREYAPAANTAVNSAAYNARPASREVEYFPYRSSAINALAAQKNPMAAGALRAILPDVNSYERINVVKAILKCQGFSTSEQIGGLEAYAKSIGKQRDAAANAANTAANAVSMAANMAASVSRASGGGVAMDVAPGPPPPYSARYSANTAFTISDGDGIDEGEKAYDPAQLPIMIGSQVALDSEPSDELIEALINRLEVLDKSNPKVALTIREVMEKWSGRAINSLFLRDLKNGKAKLDAVIKLLSIRKELREKQSNELFAIRDGNPAALGISACFIEDSAEYDAILQGQETEVKIAMLACARLIRADLPVKLVAANLKDPNKTLARAAERYLESQDSPEARGIVLSLHPNEAKILGAREAFNSDSESAVFASPEFLAQLFASVTNNLSPYYYFGTSEGTGKIEETEKKLQKELKENAEILGIYAYENHFVRIYKDKAVFSWEEDTARYRERTLSAEEFDSLKNYISSQRIDEYPPFVGPCERCMSKELIMVGRNGGRRVYASLDETPKIFSDLEGIFAEMKRQPSKLHYWLEKYIPGLEILFEDEKLSAVAVWKAPDTLKVLIEDPDRRKIVDKELGKAANADYSKAESGDTEPDYEAIDAAQRKRREQRAFDEFSWHRIDQNKLGEITAQPREAEFIPNRDSFFDTPSAEAWKRRAGGLYLRSMDDGVYKVLNGQRSRIRTGIYGEIALAASGRWALARKFTDEEPLLVRINLLTNKELKININTDYPEIRPVAFVASTNKFLVFAGYYSDGEDGEDTGYTDREGEFFWYDPETGLIQKAKGELRPLIQQTYRPLQPTGAANEFWAAIPEEDSTLFGRYDAKLGKFTLIQKLPNISFDSMDIFADEKGGKLYFVYEGHLLSIPIAKK